MIEEGLKSDPSGNFIAGFQFRLRRKLPRISTDCSIDRATLPTDKEVELAIAKSSPRTSLLIQALRYSGAWISELLSIRLSDSLLKGKTRTFTVQGKGGTSNRIRLPEDLIREFRSAYGHSDYLFAVRRKPYTRQHATRLIRQACEEILGTAYHARSFRHFVATKIIDQTGQVKIAASWLNHRDTRTTERIYNNPAIDSEKIFQMMGGLPGRTAKKPNSSRR